MIYGNVLLILVAVVLAVLGVVNGSDPLLVGSIVVSLVTVAMLAVNLRQAASARADAAGADSGTADEPLSAPNPVAVADLGVISVTPRPESPGVVVTPRSESPGVVVTPRSESPDAAVVARPDVTVPRPSIPNQYAPPPGAQLPGNGPLNGNGPATDEYSDVRGSERAVEFDLLPASSAAATNSASVGPDADVAGSGPVPVAVDGRPSDELSVEVAVIDGRPRYHRPTCPAVAGKDPDTLPRSEAVRLGFTPCGRCGPADDPSDDDFGRR